MSVPVFRFAPSPNGPLHEGHALSARINRRMADARGGRFLIRIEDIDTVRCTPALCERALADLAEVGIVSDGPVLWQSDRIEIYRAALYALRERGLVYPATLSRKALRAEVERGEAAGVPWPRDPDGAPHYPSGERDRWRASPFAAEPPHAWRLDLERALDEIGGAPSWIELADEDDHTGHRVRARPERWGDPVLWRRDGVPAYHLAVVLDDAAQAVTHVVRGTDLREATSLHRVLQSLLGLPEPRYLHHALLTDAAGRKLSKSAGDGIERPIVRVGNVDQG